MSEEEKEAIENLKKNRGISFKEADVLSNLIDKQQKEIEGKNAVIDTFKHTEKVLTEQIDKQQKEIEERDKYNITTLPFEELKEMIEQNKNISIFGKEYISKNKIREKIEKIKTKTIGASTGIYAIQIDILEELLEEN